MQPRETWQSTLICSWDSLLGNLGAHVQLEKIEADTLVLGVYDACWMQELYLMSPMLIATINQKLDRPRIKHLRFKRAVTRKRSIPRTTEPATRPTHHVVLQPTEKAALQKIKDPQLGLAMEQFLIRCYKEKA
jgi:hypothetical protein